MFSTEAETKIKPNGNEVTTTYIEADRYLFDFNICKPDDGWISMELSSDAPYFGVWVHPVKLETMQYVEGDVYHTVCVDRQRYIDEVDGLLAAYGVAPAFTSIDTDTGTVTKHYQSRETYLPPDDHLGYGRLAHSILGEEFNLQVMKSNSGYYIGTQDDEGMPVSRESVEYWDSQADADNALQNSSWTQKQEP